MSKEKVSIVVPTYNRADDIEQALNSLLKINYPNYEIIVVDDASKDGTLERLKKFGNKIRIVKRKKNGGPAAARNGGVKASRGELIAFTDSDCTVSRDWIRTLVKFIETQPENVAGVCGTIYPPKDANFLMKLIYFMPQMDGNTTLAERRKEPFEVNNISCNNALWRADIIKKMKGFNESFFRDFRTVPEDSELCYRTLKSGYKFYMYPGAPTYHHFRPTLYEFLKQSYRAGRGGGVVLFKHPAWFGAQTVLILAFPAFVVLSVFNPLLLLSPMILSAPVALNAFKKTEDLKYAAAAPFLWLVKAYANIIGVWKGILDVVTRK
ncbi:MAG: glycosyltransferase [Candidatus Aenigmarchaeota archaeon]|nr:glycosyltransferase [Candidatus Aenigmarchaeota archaeon]